MAMKLTEIVATEAVIADLQSTERDDVIAELIDALVQSGAAEAEHRDTLISAVLEREHKGSTGFGAALRYPM